MSWEVWGTPPDPEPVCCPNCGETQHTPGCEYCELDMKRIEAERRLTVTRYELQAAHHRIEKMVELMHGIHALLYPSPVRLDDGRTFVFRPNDPNPHEILQSLSDRIRALPDELAKIK